MSWKEWCGKESTTTQRAAACEDGKVLIIFTGSCRGLPPMRTFAFMNYAEFEPPPALQAYVRCVWSLSAPETAAASPPEPALPDGSSELIFSCGDAMRALDDGGTWVPQPSAMLVGQVTRPFIVAPSGRMDLVAVRFRPEGAVLVCDDLRPLTNTWTAIEHLPAPELVHAARSLSESESPEDRRSAILDALERLRHRREPPDPTVRSAVDAIEHAHGALALDDLADRLGCSPRHLQRLFAREVGISPKMLARIRRFQRVFTSWRENPQSLSRVAAECGYFDQPHLIRDFRDFAGAAPAAFLANQPEFTQLFLSTNTRQPHISGP